MSLSLLKHLNQHTSKCFTKSFSFKFNSPRCTPVAVKSKWGRCCEQNLELLYLKQFSRSSTRCSDILNNFSITIFCHHFHHHCYNNIYVISLSPRTAKLWDYVPIKCFSLIYNLNGFKSRINRHLLTLGSF